MKTSIIVKTEFQTTDAIIKNGAKTFMAVGTALVRMHDKKLYLEKFKTFEEYAASRGIKRRNAYKLMTAVKTSLELADSVPNLAQSFTNASQLSAIAQLPKAERAAAAKEIIQSVKKAGGNVTASAITAAHEKLHPRKPKASTPPASEEPCQIPPHAAPEPEQDETIEPITPKEFQSTLNTLEARIEAAAKTEAEHHKFGVMANALAGRLMNWRPAKKEFSPYTN